MSVTDEKKFLHEISNPISTVFLMVDSVLESMSNRPDANKDELEQLKKAMDSLVRINTLIQNRRGALTQQAPA